MFKQKFNISDLVDLQQKQLFVVVAEPITDLAALYKRYLSQSGFVVNHHSDAESLHAALGVLQPDVLLLSSQQYEKVNQVVAAVKKALEQNPKLYIITVGFDTPSDHLQQYMNAGIASHINRKTSRPNDVVDIIHTLFNQE